MAEQQRSSGMHGQRALRLSVSLGLSTSLGVGLMGCGPVRPPRPAALVQSVLPERLPFSETLDTVSTLEALDEVELASQAGGRVQRVLVRAGEPVRAGQLLLVLDQTQLRAEVAALRAKADRDQISYRRYEGLVNQGAASALQRDEYKAAAISSREALRGRLADLAYKDLRAPIGGVMGDLSVKAGDVLQAGTAFSRIIRNTPLQARIDIPANQANRVRPGQLVQLLAGADAPPLAQGRISMLDPGVSASSQTLLAKATIPNPKGQLRNGERLRTRVVLAEQRQLAVPFSAVSRQFGQAFLFVLGTAEQLRRDPGRSDRQLLNSLPPGALVALQRPVQLGALQDNRYAVLQGLNPGERVIVSATAGLRHGAPVRLSRAAAPRGGQPAPPAPGAN